eukprot:scaffold155360_cov25-Tisochrysis_lutea.AAC.3
MAESRRQRRRAPPPDRAVARALAPRAQSRAGRCSNRRHPAPVWPALLRRVQRAPTQARTSGGAPAHRQLAAAAQRRGCARSPTRRATTAA